MEVAPAVQVDIVWHSLRRTAGRHSNIFVIIQKFDFEHQWLLASYTCGHVGMVG
jgi:hypothetical protein